MKPEDRGPGPVLFYDGQCGLCQGLVRILLRLDGRRFFRYETLQSPEARAFLEGRGLSPVDFESMILVDDGAAPLTSAFALRTNAALRVLAGLGGGWRLVALLRVIPAGWRDCLYRLVARHRHRFFRRGRTPETGGP